jgi:DNA-binding NtrC family response regulator
MTQARGQDSDGGKALLLLVEDERTQRELLKALLEAEGFRVLAASDGEEALRVFAEVKNEISLVISDLRMPGMDGYHLLLAMKQLRPDVMVIVLSGHINAQIEADLIQEGAVAVLQKPLHPRRFLDLVHHSMSGQNSA